MKHLVIPDVHAKPGTSNVRLEWAGKLALAERPDVIIQLGDFFDMPSLSSYDKGKKSFEGRRYKHDVAAGIKAMEAFNAPIDKWNAMRAKNKKKQYTPRKIMLTGNHEQRISRVSQLAPELDGVVSYADLEREEHGWETYNFLVPAYVDGITYSHYFISGIMGRPISGENPARAILQKKYSSCTGGHQHVLDWSERTDVQGRKIMGLVAGCFFEWDEGWAQPEVNDMWWRGLIMKHDVHDGLYDLETWSLDRLWREFG